ncbi:MAG: 2-hydroxyacyl-CoA dehydratase family protein [Coriobacteriia bacterium]|nr:2-hydroxyacyl-CoA dehydratase family protein [Coriobacteriia bacterium]
MSNYAEILAQLDEAACDPWLAVRQAKAEGKKVVGCVPYFVPMELVHAAGMHPVELWGGGKIAGTGSSYYPAFYCSLLFTLIERALDGSYDDLDAVIVPTTCDGLRNLEENWKFARPEANVIDFVQPVVRDTPEAHRYFRGQLRAVASRLGDVADAPVSERALRESIEAYNRQRRAMRQFSELAAQHLDAINAQARWAVFAAARSMAVEAHTALVEQLNDELAALSVYEHDGVKVLLTGIMVDSLPLLQTLESNDVAVVGDLTVSESARYVQDVPGKVDPYDSLVAAWQDVKGVSVALDPKKLRGDMLVEMARERGADGVIACIVKFCETEEFDVPVLKQQMARAGLPLLVIEMEMQNAVSEQAATRIQAFAEMIDAAR